MQSKTTLLTLSTFIGLAFAAGPGPAGAQEKPNRPVLPLKQNTPLFDKRALKIPGKMPEIKRKSRPNKPKVSPIEKRKGRGQPAPTSGSPGFGDIKKTAGKKCKPLKNRDKVQFEFKGADIKDVVAAISKHLCKNFIITSKVRSQKFDIISPTPITVEEAWRAFLSALEANDFTLVRAGRYYKIIQSTDGTRSPVPMYDREKKVPATDQVVTRIWTMDTGTDTAAMVNYLNIFKSSKGQLHPFVATGTIIATDYARSIRRLERILKEINKPGILEHIHIVGIQFATASEIAEKLNQIFEPTAKATRGKAGAKGGISKARVQVGKKGQPEIPPGEGPDGGDKGGWSVSKIIADDRTNKLIIIASGRSFRQIMALKRQLDVPSDEGEGLVHVLRLKHANAEELASTLSALATGRPSGPKRTTRKTTRGAKAKAKKTAPGSASLFQGEVKVTSDKPTNSLVITASKGDFAAMKRVIAQLDIPRFQVFVEAAVLEVSVKDDRTLGTSWFGGVPVELDGQESPIVFGSNPSRDLSAFQTLATNPLGFASLLGLAGAIRGPPLEGTEQIVQGGIPSLGLLVQALKTYNNVNIISTPHLLTMDNEEAEIQVNEKRPFASGVSLGGLGGLSGLAGSLGGLTGGAGAAANALGNLGGLGLGSVNINREDVGLTLKLKPQINNQEYVRLELDQELSDVAGVDQVTGQTITSKRSAKTVVVVRDQDSVVIGGLVRDRESKDESKIPLLGDLPVLGWLFKRQQRITEKVNLLLILTPYIIRGPEDFRKIYERKLEERREFVEAYYGSTEEYRANIDWQRKLGPLANFRREIRVEMSKAENEGPGSPEEVIIRAEEDMVIEEGAETPSKDAKSPAIDEDDI